jgi:hypothetical protein
MVLCFYPEIAGNSTIYPLYVTKSVFFPGSGSTTSWVAFFIDTQWQITYTPALKKGTSYRLTSPIARPEKSL